MPDSSADPEADAIRDPHRIAAARRLLAEVSGPAAYDRLSSLAARLLGVGHAKVTIFTDQDTVVGGFGLPPGVVGGPALLTGALSAITVRQRRPLRIDSAATDERVAGLPTSTSGEVQSYLGAPLRSDSGHVVGVLAVYDSTPRSWSEDAADLLDELGSSVVAELELAAARTAIGTSLARLDVALEASSVGTWEVDLVRGVMDWDERCAAIFGYEGAVNLPMDRLFAEHVHPGDLDSAQAAMQAAIEAKAQYTVELRVVRAGDGGIRWTVSRGRVLANPVGEPVRILGTVLDVTDAREESASRLAAIQRAAAIAEVAAQAANAAGIAQLADITLRGAEVLGADSGGVAVFDPEDGLLRVHLGRRLIESVEAETREPVPEGGVVIELDDTLPTQYTARTGERVLLASADEGAQRFPAMARITEVLGIRSLASLPLVVEGRVLGSFVATWTTDHRFSDEDVELLDGLTAQITLSVSRLQADRQRATAVQAMKEANQRLQLLADAGRMLAGALTIDEQLRRLAPLVVPPLGDWCWIVATDDHGRLCERASAHRDPARTADVEAYVRLMMASITDESAPRIVFRTGKPLVIPDLQPERIAQSLTDDIARAALLALAPGSVLAVPLAARGHTLGVLCLLNGAERGPHTESEIQAALEIGRRAGSALDQARLFGKQRELADALQRSMLTEPPAIEGCEVVVRYVPAAEGAEVGGDWYDAFHDRSGHPVLAIGDVVGHDTRAAAAMGQVRGLLRGISFSSGGTPAEVLRRVDRAVDGLALDTMATALVARLERGEGGDGTLLRFSNAGHPPAVLVDAAGEVSVLDPTPADLLLGVSPEAPREDHVELLPSGATLLLYTDGLVERRDRDIDAGTEALVAALRGSADLPLGELCDHVLERLVLPDAEDDVAVLAFRLTPPA
jgi:PAS domain S-box-containing protein